MCVANLHIPRVTLQKSWHNAPRDKIHGPLFTREDFIRFERVNREIMDDDMVEMLRKNPPDGRYATGWQLRRFFASLLFPYFLRLELRRRVLLLTLEDSAENMHFLAIVVPPLSPH